MKGKRYIVGIGLILIIIGIVFLALMGNKITNQMSNKTNEYGTIYSFFDDQRIYVSSMELTYKLETKQTYSEDIKLNNNKKHTIFINKNELSKDITIELKDSNSNIICTQILKKGQSKIYLGESKYNGGEYKLDISLPENCEGTLEIKIDE